jgi:hypothetical protein
MMGMRPKWSWGYSSAAQLEAVMPTGKMTETRSGLEASKTGAIVGAAIGAVAAPVAVFALFGIYFAPGMMEAGLGICFCVVPMISTVGAVVGGILGWIAGLILMRYKAQS